MANLSKAEAMYLLHALAYAEEGGAPRGVLRARLPAALQGGAESACKGLLKKGLLQETARSSVAATESGVAALVAHLRTTGMAFATAKGPRILNALADLFKIAAPATKLTTEMDYDTFVERFRRLYDQEKLQQEKRGIVAIHTQDLRDRFLRHEGLSPDRFDEHLARLKASRQVFTMVEKSHELLRWAE